MRGLTRRLTAAKRRRNDSARRAAELATLAPFVDANWYRKQYQDVAGAGVDPLAHYASEGWREGRQPHPLFDPAYYLEINGDVRAAGVDPLRHYIESGWREERRPHLLFDHQRYADTYGVGAVSGQNPLLHYLSEGWRLGHEPHLLFKTTWYLCINADVGAADTEPLSHYLTDGWREGRRPHPAFDPGWYLDTHRDVGRQRPEPLQHYLKHGWQEGRAPIETLHDRSRNRKPAELVDGLTPLELYVTSATYRRTGDPELFDAAYYRTLYGDLAGLGDTELYRHFVTKGFAEGRVGKAVRPARVGPKPPAATQPARPRTPVPHEGRPQFSAPLIIAGFHRSGTSMTANLLADAGLHVGDELLGAKPSNPYGHFEDLEIIRFHDGLLRQSGQNWLTATDFPAIVTRKDWRFMVTYGSRKAMHRAWGFKDPRVCLFLPQWHATYPDMSLLYVYRPCIECVHSIRKRAADNFVRNQAPGMAFNFFKTSDIAVRMYLNYSHQALRFMETFTGRMKVVALADLLNNRDIVAEIRKDWGYRFADVLPFDVYDGKSLTSGGPNEVIHDRALIDEVRQVEERFQAMLN